MVFPPTRTRARPARRSQPAVLLRRSLLWLALTLVSSAFSRSLPVGNSRAAPETWDLWRCGPFAFPDHLEPLVPEAVPNAAVEFGPGGADLAIIVPAAVGSDRDGRALEAMVRMIKEKAPRATVVPADADPAPVRGKHWLVLGTAAENAFVARVTTPEQGPPPAGRPGGYSVRMVERRDAPGRKVILALGADRRGAWAAAALLAYSIHPASRGLTPLHPWPVRLPDGVYWAPFTADCAGENDTPALAPGATPVPLPRVPFGVRIWGSPMPTLGSYQRLMHALHGLGINTVAVQGGGWPDLADAPARYRAAVNLAAREGIATILYVGNDLVSHHPAPLTDTLRAVVLATKDLPGLLEFHVYNQLTASLSPAERKLVEEQVRWLRSVTRKRIGMEVVWGHDAAAIPADKAQLITDLKSWGVDVIANDCAPIGGWSRKHQVAIWEPRLRALAPFGLPVEAVLQAHVPFVDPTLPTAAEVRSQFWWAAAGGARGFLVEAAYVFTSLSNRGLLSWDLRPEPDGRADEVRRLAGIARATEPFTSDARPVTSETGDRWGLALADGGAALRFYQTAAGRRFALIINPSTTKSAAITLRGKPGLRLNELAPGNSLHPAVDGWALILAPGDGACLELLGPSP